MPNIQELVGEIRGEHRRRVFMMEQRKRIDLASGAYLRISLGFKRTPSAEEVERRGIKKDELAAIAAGNKVATAQASEIMKAAEEYDRLVQKEKAKKALVPTYETKDLPYPTVPHFDRYGSETLASFEARAAINRIEEDAARHMTHLAMELPVWKEFAEHIKGFGALSLAVIVAETGDLSAYASPGKVWRRMGVAPAVGNDGLDHLPSALRKHNLTAAEWKAIKYSPSRRSRMFVIADSLLKQQNEYRDIFNARRAYEHRKAEMACRVPATEVKATVESWEKNGLPPLSLVKKIDPDLHMSAGHMTARARVYVEKRLLKHLWQNWRRLEGLSWEDPEEYRDAA